MGKHFEKAKHEIFAAYLDATVAMQNLEEVLERYPDGGAVPAGLAQEWEDLHNDLQALDLVHNYIRYRLDDDLELNREDAEAVEP